jgi:hypothetical protein
MSSRFAPPRLLLLGLCALTACAGGDAPTTPAPPPPVTPAPVTTGLLSLTAAGLPAGATADLLVTGTSPNSSYTRLATGTVTWADIPAGRYTVHVRTVRTTLGAFAGAPTAFDVDVPAGGPMSVATASYRPVPSSFMPDVRGLPATASATVSVTPPGGAPTAVASGSVLSAPQLPVGSATPDLWRVVAAEVQAEGARWTPSPVSLDTLVPFGDTARVVVRYDIASGALALVVAGLPASLQANVHVIGPDNSVRVVTATGTVTGLAPGRYRVVPQPLSQGGIAYRATADTLDVTVSASLVAAPATLTYVAQVGTLALTVIGLPAGTAAPITLASAGVQRALTGTVTIDSLASGSYTLAAQQVVAGNERYAPSPLQQTVIISTGSSASASISYTSMPTVVDVPVSGLPAGSSAAITLLSPSGASIDVSASQRLAPAAAGRWRLSAASVTTPTGTYTPAPAAYDLVVGAGDTLRLPVAYSLSTGSLALVVSGLPAGTSGAISISGPAGFSRTATATSTFTSLVPGTYTIAAGTVSAAMV